MATPSETSLLLAMATTSPPGNKGIDWVSVSNALDCNPKAAMERWRSFKTKLPLPAGQAASDAQAKLLLAIVGGVKIEGAQWEAVGQMLGCNKKAAAERWRAFRAKRGLGGKGEGGEKVVKGVKGEGAGEKKNSKGGKKRKANESEDDEEAGSTKEDGRVRSPAKKRARAKADSTKSKTAKSKAKTVKEEPVKAEEQEIVYGDEEQYGEDEDTGVGAQEVEEFYDAEEDSQEFEV